MFKPRFLLPAILLAAAGCADTSHRLVVSVPEQRLLVLDRGRPVASYPVSTSKFGLGDAPGSNGTPLGELEIAKKIGDGAPLGAVFKGREPTGEVLVPDAPGRDPIVTRILWLRGRDGENFNAFDRYIYIHGTPEERNVGRPASYGCVRMRSRDVMALYDTVGWGARVSIRNEPMFTAAVPYLKLAPGENSPLVAAARTAPPQVATGTPATGDAPPTAAPLGASETDTARAAARVSAGLPPAPPTAR